MKVECMLSDRFNTSKRRPVGLSMGNPGVIAGLGLHRSGSNVIVFQTKEIHRELWNMDNHQTIVI